MGFVYEGTMVDLGHGRGWMNGPAAASLWRLDAEIGRPWGINEAGRTWAEQNDHYQRYLREGYPIALSPDAPSLHQRGNAMDTNDQMTGRLNDHGWFQTVYRWVNGVWTLVEPWHYEYFSDRDNHINEAPPLTEEDMAGPIFVHVPGVTWTSFSVEAGRFNPRTDEEAHAMAAAWGEIKTDQRQFDVINNLYEGVHTQYLMRLTEAIRAAGGVPTEPTEPDFPKA